MFVIIAGLSFWTIRLIRFVRLKVDLGLQMECVIPRWNTIAKLLWNVNPVKQSIKKDNQITKYKQITAKQIFQKHFIFTLSFIYKHLVNDELIKTWINICRWLISGLPAYPVDCTNWSEELSIIHRSGNSDLWSHYNWTWVIMANQHHTWRENRGL